MSDAPGPYSFDNDLTTVLSARKRAQRFAAAVVCAALAAAMTAGCSRHDSADHQIRVPVLVAPVVKKTVPDEIAAIGTVQPYSTVQVRAQVGGQLVAVHFQQGDDVKTGALLFTIDQRPFIAAVNQAEANLQRDVANEKQAEADEGRYQYLLQERIGSQQQYDQAHATAAAMRATVAADKAALETAKLNLQYTEIRSPIDGRTGDLLVHVGNVIKANDDNPLLVINQIRPVYVGFSLPEKDLAEVRLEMGSHKLQVNATIPSAPQINEAGELAFIDNSVDKTTGTIILKGLFENPEERLWPGEFVNVSLTLGERPDTILVPSQAIQNGQEGTFVFVIDKDMVAQPRNVITGDTFNGQTIIKSGLSAGETIVTDGQLRLSPGAHVTIKTGLDSGQGIAS